ncbi:MAG TPA: ABC transporter permease [Candidatus Limnocylindria bacterium]|nr:ABC transporter permease [Candidatus Limnocylindria bacterium]
MTGRAAARGVSPAIGVGRTRLPLGTIYAVLLAFLYLPILLLFLFSFSTNRGLTFPIDGLTLDRYGAVLDNRQMLNAARNSLIVGVLSASVATAMGLAVGIAATRLQFRGRRVLVGLAAAPLLIPYVVLAVGLFLMFNLLNVPRGILTVAAAHSVIALPYAVLILLARLVGLDPALEDAAMDLGATYPVTLRRVVLPLLGPSLLSAWLTCFIVSFDEIAIANLLSGKDATFPVFLYGQLRFAGQVPVLVAMAVLLLIGTLVLTVVAQRIRSND